MTEPTIVCPKCKTEIKLTESLSAPLIESTRHEYEQRLAQKDADIAKREEALSKAKGTLDNQVAEKLREERAKIVVEEARKAKLLLGTDLDRKVKEVADLQEVLKQRDAKLAEAQNAQAELVRKQRELDDTKRELELTIEKRIQAGLETTRQQAREEAEGQLQSKVVEKDQAIASMLKQIEELKTKDAEIANREKALSKAKESMETEVAEKLRQERAKIAVEESRKVKLAMGIDLEQKTKELGELQEVLKQRDAKLAEAQKAQAEFVRKERELDDTKRELDLTVEKRVQEGLAATREQAKKEAEDQLKLKVMEKEQTILSMQKQIEDLKRSAEQGSQQRQGEVQELDLEAVLRAKFPLDVIEPVSKGERGGDVLHRVVGPLGQVCGTILWESKRTKSWSDGWLAKLRDDQRSEKADIAVIVSQTLPKGIETFGLIDHVWIADPRSVVPVAVALRHMSVEVASAHQASEGQQTKTEMIYQYLTGPRFRQRVQAIVEAFSSMQEDLDKERKAITKQWAKREEQIERVMQATVGMYGDLQGIAGKSLQEIEGLEFPALEGPNPVSDEPMAK